jgi:rfaE bifunctional protein kinase chain/domain
MPEEEALPEADRLLDLIDAMGGQPVIMLVDLVADRFITGVPKRISREAPVLILSYDGETFVPGGGANAVANVAALGGRPLPLGVVGQDRNGGRLLEAFEERGVTTEGILRRDSYGTPTKTRILSGGRHSIKQQIVRYDVDDHLELGEDERRHFERHLAAWEGLASVAVLSDYGYGTVEPGLIPPIRQALAEDSTVLCDSRHRLQEFQGLDGATPNEEEAREILGRPISDEPRQLLENGDHIRRRLGAQFLLITRGSFGMSLFDARGGYRIPVHGTDQVADVTGAGDTVIGTFALALAAGASPVEATLLADYAGGVVVMKTGTATLSRAELAAAVSSDPGPLEESLWEKY